MRIRKMARIWYQSPEIVIDFIIIGVFGLSPVVGTSEVCGVCVLVSAHGICARCVHGLCTADCTVCGLGVRNFVFWVLGSGLLHVGNWKGARCAHLPQCNYETLREHASRVRACPIAGCCAPLQRSRDVERDDTLAAQLRQLPPGTVRVWVRGAEVRAAIVATAQPAVQQRRRSQRCDKNNLVVLD